MARMPNAITHRSSSVNREKDAEGATAVYGVCERPTIHWHFSQCSSSDSAPRCSQYVAVYGRRYSIVPLIYSRAPAVYLSIRSAEHTTMARITSHHTSVSPSPHGRIAGLHYARSFVFHFSSRESDLRSVLSAAMQQRPGNKRYSYRTFSCKDSTARVKNPSPSSPGTTTPKTGGQFKLLASVGYRVGKINARWRQDTCSEMDGQVVVVKLTRKA